MSKKVKVDRRRQPGSSKRAGSTGRTKGLVLVAVLWMVVLLIVIAAVMGRNSRLDTRVSVLTAEQVRCKWAGRAGLETTLAVMQEDYRASDSLTDLWSDNDEDFNDVFVERCWFTVRAIDEASKLNVNTATKEQLMGLWGMTEEIADSIIDWRDEDDVLSPAGVEGGYYENLAYGYQIRNGPFRTIRELLLVKGMTEELLYGEDTNFNSRLDFNERDGDVSPPRDNGDNVLDKGWIEYMTCYSYDQNKDAGGNDRININEADENRLQEDLEIKQSYARWIVENRGNDGYESIADLINEQSPKEPSDSEDSNQPEPLDMQTFSRIADRITVKEDERIAGRVNVNTADKPVLAALLGGDEEAERKADAIIGYRDRLFGGMVSIAEVMQVEAIDINTFKDIAEYITTRSDVFTVRCFAQADRGDMLGSALQTETVVDRSSRPGKVLYWYQGVSN